MIGATYRFTPRAIAHLVIVSYPTGSSQPRAATACKKVLHLDNLLGVRDDVIECQTCQRAVKRRVVDSADVIRDRILSAYPQRAVKWQHWNGMWKDGVEYGIRSGSWAYVRPASSPKVRRMEADKVRLL